MERRAFLKTSAFTIGAVSMLPNQLLAGEKSRRFKVILDYDIKYDEKNFAAKLWNPIPFDSDYQKVKFLKFSGNYNDYNINEENPYDAKMLYASWDKGETKKTLHVEMQIETTYRKVSLKFIKKASHENLPIPENVKMYLEATAHIPTTGELKELAEKITKGKTDRFDKVKAIYDWVTYTTFRDPKVLGCGVGDAGKMVKSGYFGGKCTDISSLFVALLRASGIPAREVFGIRLGKSEYSKALGKSDAKGFATISSWQHCRAEYYIPGAGWIPSDPADITKLELVERLKYDDKKVKELTSRYLHSWEMNWVGFNHARDFVLSPKPTQFPLNMLGYPYAEANGDPLNYYSPKTFAYKITSQEIK
ncbi:MAG: transglutaminase family protein [Sulfurospirillaceae bacterium]|nr:transglutaminase family protein [Sulfurospirillaceae bacterium]